MTNMKKLVSWNICVRQENRCFEKLRYDISDTGNRIIVLLEDLHTVHKSNRKSDMWKLIRQSRRDRHHETWEAIQKMCSGGHYF